MGNPAGHFCCCAGHESPDAAAPRHGGDLEDEARAPDLAARLRVSSRAPTTALAGWATLKTSLSITLTACGPPKSSGSAGAAKFPWKEDVCDLSP